ncbi:MAG: hypothetical protein GY769_20140 [bacterium]|nr:hypothetical protein [bacterium]
MTKKTRREEIKRDLHQALKYAFDNPTRDTVDSVAWAIANQLDELHDRVDAALAARADESEPETLLSKFEAQHDEHEAWLQLCKHLETTHDIEVNAETTTPLIMAIRLWGEELHRLRLTCPEYDDDGLTDARRNYAPYKKEIT